MHEDEKGDAAMRVRDGDIRTACITRLGGAGTNGESVGEIGTGNVTGGTTGPTLNVLYYSVYTHV